MRRHWPSRLFSACLAVWFVLSVGEPSFVRVCPEHGGTAGPHQMGGAHGHAVHHSSTSDSPTPGHHTHHCSCISCCVGSGNAAPAPAPVALTDAIAFVASVRLATPETLPRLAPPYTLPLATGPPRA